MAIKKIIGKIDNREIVLNKDGSNNWIATIPSNLEGEYVVEITAIDEAGNESYSACMVFIIEPSTLEVKILPLNYSSVEEKENYIDEKEATEYSFINLENNFSYKQLPQNYVVEVVDR